MSKKTVLCTAGLLILVALFASVWLLTKPETALGDKNLQIRVVHGDQRVVEYAIETDAEYLADVLVGEAIVEDDQGPYGLYILTVDGETAEESLQEWWCITRNGESLMTGASETPVMDGDAYELTLTVGYDF